MKVFWWQGGVHVEPENDQERTALKVLTDTANVKAELIEQSSGGSNGS